MSDKLNSALGLAKQIYEDLVKWEDPETAAYTARDLILLLEEIKETVRG
jgi:hypothetical protein